MTTARARPHCSGSRRIEMRTVAVMSVVLGLVGGGVARAEGPETKGAAHCTLRVVQASKGPGGVDPRITRLGPFLSKPPFTEWKHFTLLSEKEEAILPGATAAYALPNG